MFFLDFHYLFTSLFDYLFIPFVVDTLDSDDEDELMSSEVCLQFSTLQR